MEGVTKYQDVNIGISTGMQIDRGIPATDDNCSERGVLSSSCWLCEHIKRQINSFNQTSINERKQMKIRVQL